MQLLKASRLSLQQPFYAKLCSFKSGSGELSGCSLLFPSNKCDTPDFQGIGETDGKTVA